MPAANFGVVCSTASGIIRRIVYADTTIQLSGIANVQSGETLVLVSSGPYPNSTAWRTAINTAVQTATGKIPGSSRCCVIDGGGNVVQVISADPALDSMPGMTLVLSDVANIGWTWTVGGGFVSPPPDPPLKS